MSDDYRRIELITGTARRRHWATDQKLDTSKNRGGSTMAFWAGHRRGGLVGIFDPTGVLLGLEGEITSSLRAR